MTATPHPVPLVCDMSGAAETPQERLAEYRRLFAHALAGRERTPDAVRWRFIARPGVEAWVRDLADREARCCPFLAYAVTADDHEVVFEIAGGGDARHQPILDMVHDLPAAAADGFPDLGRRLADLGLEIRTDVR